MKRPLHLLILSLLLQPACSDTPASQRDSGGDLIVYVDAGPDAPRPDVGAQDVALADDGAGDLTPDGLALDAGGDLPRADLNGWDLSLSPSTVLYTATPNSASFTMRQVSGAGSGSPKAVAGWSGLLALEDLQLAAMTPYLGVNATAPQLTQEAHTGFTGIRLPGGLGTVHYYHRKLSGTSGLMLVPAKGPPKVLLEVTGLYADTLSNTFGFSLDGKVGAAVEGKTKVHLFRTDGGTLSGGKSVLDISPAASATTYASFSAPSLTFAGTHIYCVGRDKAGNDQLLRAPADGATPLAPLTLPQSAGATPMVVNPQMVVSADNKTLAFTAGSMGTVTDLYVLDLASGKARNLTASPSYISIRGSSFGSLGGQLAISPKGEQVAFVKWVNGTPELYITGTAVGAKPLLLSDLTRFKGSVTAFYNLILPDEQNLLFMSGEVYYYMDLFRYDVKNKKLSNLSGSGGLAQPFDGQGDYSPQGAWVSPNGKWFYWVGYDYYASPSATADIMAVDLTSYKHSKITSGVRVATSSDGLASCPGDGTVFWAVEKTPGTYSQELYAFNQDKGQAAKRVTNMTRGTSAYWFATSLILTQGCGRLAWAAGGGYSMRHIFVMNPKLPLTERQLTKTPRYVAPRLTFSPDGLSLLFGSGGGISASTLKTVTIAGGGATQLDPTAGHLHIFRVY